MNTIRTRSLIAMIIAGVVPLVVMFVMVYMVVRQAIHNSERDKLDEISDQLGRNVTAIMEGASNDLRSLQTNPVLSDLELPDDARLSEMERLVGVYDAFSDISLYDIEGYLIDSTTTEEPMWREYSKWFSLARIGETAMSDPMPATGKEGLLLSVYMPLFDVGGEVQNVLVARISFQRVIGLLRGVRFGINGRALLLDSFGNLICHHDDEQLSEKFDRRIPAEFWQANPSGEYTDPGGEPYLYQAVKMSPADTYVDGSWFLLALRPMSEVNSLLRKTEAISLFSFLVALLFTGILSLVYSRHISAPVVAANEVALKVASGDLGARMGERGPEEMRSLGAAFNLMVKELDEHRSGMENLVMKRTASLQDSRRQLTETMAQLHAAFDTTREAILLVDNEGVVVATNALFYEFFGLSEEEIAAEHVAGIQMRMAGLCDRPKKFQTAWTKALVDRSIVVELDYEIERPERRYLALYSAPVRVDGNQVSGRLWTWRDLTEHRTLEQSLRQSQKMEAVGQLAGGVAHDFNNLLTGIVGNLALVEMQLEGPEHAESRRHINMAAKAGNRAAELIKQLLGFSRRSHLKLRAAQANAVVEDVRDLLTASIDPKVQIEVRPADEAWPVLIDPTQLEQVVMNMCVNAKDALGNDGGTIVLSTANKTVSSEELSMHADAKAGEFLCLSVEDDGEGMPAAVRTKIFEPFFTTKEQGKGTGLGLATSFGIVKQLGGWITCDSAPGKGTRFDIYLPRTAEKLESQEETKLTLSEASNGCSETLLLVDDEIVVRNVAETLLGKLGYKVLVAGDGEEALEVFAEHEDDIDLVMLDLTMPKLSGKETFRRLRDDWDYVPVLICSGYLLDLTAFEEETGFRPDGFVQKPYKMETMAATVRQVINQAREAA